MPSSGRVQPLNDDFEHCSNRTDKPSHTARVGRRDAYEVDEGIDDGAEVVSMNEAAREAEVVGKTSDILLKRFVIALLAFVSLLSITTFILTVGMISGKIWNRCSCEADSITAGN